jgi:recombination protein RecR
MDEVEKLAKLFSEFPGIGARQSKRFVYFLLGKDQAYISELTDKLRQLKQKITRCNTCFRFFPSDGNEICDVCASPKTDQKTLLIVEKDSDFENVRRSKSYSGAYFILGGIIPIIDKITPQKIRINELYERVSKMAGNGLLEVIVALSLNPSGEHTDSYIKEKLSPLIEKYSFKITSLGRGLSTGSELEYTDDETIKNAMKNRQ